MLKRILSVSYDDVLLATRKMLLEQKGYSVISALGFREAVEHCQSDAFDLFILGHSIPEKDKLHLIGAFRGSCPAPILSLERIGEKQVQCDFHASPDDPENFLQVVDDILSGRENRSEQRSESPAHIPTARQTDASN
jgi:DNA-binding NtrC family response regulator